MEFHEIYSIGALQRILREDALKHVERPGGSHTALDGKKNLICLRVL